MAIYNETLIDNAKNPWELVTALNTLSNKMLFSMIFIVLYFILFAVFKQFYIRAVLLGISFMMLFLGILLLFAQLITWHILIIPIIMIIGSFIIFKFVE